MATISSRILENVIRPLGKQKKNTPYLIATARIYVGWGEKLPVDMHWLRALPGVNQKIASVEYHLSKKEKEPEGGVPTNVHVFAMARADHWVNDGDRMPQQAAATLESWIPNERWYETNMKLGGVAQLITRGNEAETQLFVDALLKDPRTRRWIVVVCTSAHYRDKAMKYVQDAMEEDPRLALLDPVWV
jgi:endonuclease III